MALAGLTTYGQAHGSANESTRTSTTQPAAHLDPAALPRGADPGIVYMVRDTILDGSRRVSAPTWGSHDALWSSGNGYLVRDRREVSTRLVFVSPSGQQRVLTRSSSFVGAAVSLSGGLIGWDQELDAQGVRKVVKVAVPHTGQVLASHQFRMASVVAVTASRVLVAEHLESGPRTLWWNYRTNTVSRLYHQAALGADVRHDRIVFDLRTDGTFCNRVSRLSNPSTTLWRSCRVYPHQWSPNGARAVATHTYYDAAGTDYWATINGTTGALLRRVTGRLDWDAAWEDNAHLLTLAQSDTGKAAIVRCNTQARCERASRLWNIPLPDPSAYYAPPPVVLSSN